MIYLFRHGETEYNLENKFLGQTDLDLCKQGIERFENIAEKLRAKKIEAVFSSCLKRAVQSAEIISKKLNIPHYIRPDLGERNLGILDGKCKSDQQYALLIPKLMSLSFAPPGGDTGDFILKRFIPEFENIAKNSQGDILVISHGGVIALYLEHIMKETKKNIFLDNGCFHLLGIDPKGEIYAKELNQTIY